MNPQFESFLKKCASNQRPNGNGTLARLKVLERERERSLRGGSNIASIKPCPNEIARVFKNLFNLK